jgi:kumamolisin
MGKHTRWAPIAGSEPRHPAGAVALSRRRGPEEIRVTLLLRPAVAPGTDTHLAGLASRLPGERKHLSWSALQRLAGVAPRDWERVEELARAAGLRIVETDRVCGSMLLAGSPVAVERAFRVKLELYQDQRGRYVSHAGPVHTPAGLAGVVEAVLGLDARPIARRHSIGPRLAGGAPAQPAHVAQTYQFPEKATGRGQSIAVIELGGGFYPADMRQYFSRLGLRAPFLSVREIEGGRNAPASQAEIRRFWESLPEKNSRGGQAPGDGLNQERIEQVGWTIETTMDIQLAAALAPAARFIVYFAPITGHGQFQAIRAALRETRNSPAILSLSWGAEEAGFNGSTVAAIERLLWLAALRGVTVCCSSGDGGDGAGADGTLGVNYPASSPHVVACGGTHLVFSRSGARETVWREEFGGRSMASAGGASRLFARPDWQASAPVREKTGAEGRGVPDVAAKADVATGYGIVAGGLDLAMGGTSAAAPLWAALVARLNEELGAPAGYLTPLLYQSRLRAGFRDITRGESGPRFQASRGWDPCTGWGSPKGTQLLEALRGR